MIRDQHGDPSPEERGQSAEAGDEPLLVGIGQIRRAEERLASPQGDETQAGHGGAERGPKSSEFPQLLQTLEPDPLVLGRLESWSGRGFGLATAGGSSHGWAPFHRKTHKTVEPFSPEVCESLEVDDHLLLFISRLAGCVDSVAALRTEWDVSHILPSSSCCEMKRRRRS
jgi:hypothetical protein